MNQKKWFRWMIWLLPAVLMAVAIVTVWLATRQKDAQVDLRGFEDREYLWENGNELKIPDENIDIRSFYVSPDGGQILLQNYHIRREAESSGGVVSQVGNFLYRWKNGKFLRLGTAQDIENPICWTEERIYFYIWDNGFYLYAGDIGQERIENIRQITLGAEEIYMEGAYAICGDKIFFRAYENFGRREFVGTLRGDKICDIRCIEVIGDDETVREAVFLGNGDRILARLEDGAGQVRTALINLSDKDVRRTEVTLPEELKGLRYICAHEAQDVIYYMDGQNTIHKATLQSFLGQLTEHNDG